MQPDHELYPIRGAWRPFEFGPWNCIGQELALLEMKLVLVLAIRQFDFSMPYDEWDQLHPKKVSNGKGLQCQCYCLLHYQPYAKHSMYLNHLHLHRIFNPVVFKINIQYTA